MSDTESDNFEDSSENVLCERDKAIKMESVLQPPSPFNFENNLTNVTSGNLCRDWEKWKKSFSIYYEACELSKKDHKVQINILLHVIGDKCREVSEQFTGESKTLKELLDKFDKFFIPKKNLAVERQKFFRRDQKELESIEQYAFELNKIASKCEFQNLQDDLVCSRLICGIQDVALSERLLREPEITLPKAIDICRLAEMSRMQAQNIKSENNQHHVHSVADHHKTSDSEIHLVKETRASSSRRNYVRGARPRPTVSASAPAPASAPRDRFPQPAEHPRGARRHDRAIQQRPREYRGCDYCGRSHRRNECPAYGQQCSRCRKMNHFARMCRVYTVQDDSSTDQDSATS
ncbi:uncharacterized protein LOC121734382 [Aricia agestis]|uniref:uncharacterized protein LOC121734382 n=1 Tax=Aricia agestis TaxID=91739 RepID=UPI001C204B8E|nr:uncharacterized protein LOC121734382 [Aricia agestis]